jgi:hypothetical protein
MKISQPVGQVANLPVVGQLPNSPETLRLILLQKQVGNLPYIDLPRGRHDLVILGKDHLRLDGFSFVAIKEG